MNGYELTEKWFSYVSENSDKVDCKHTAMYLYIVELFNKRQWVDVIGLPTDYTMSILNIGSYKTFKKTFDELVSFGFIKQVELSKNQYSSTKISLVSASVKNTKASPKHLPKQVQSNIQSSSTIIKLINIETIKQLFLSEKISVSDLKGIRDEINLLIGKEKTKKTTIPQEEIYLQFNHLLITKTENKKLIELGYTQDEITKVYRAIENYAKNKNYKSLYLTSINWLEKEFGKRVPLAEQPPKPKPITIEEMRGW